MKTIRTLIVKIKLKFEIPMDNKFLLDLVFYGFGSTMPHELSNQYLLSIKHSFLFGPPLWAWILWMMSSIWKDYVGYFNS